MDNYHVNYSSVPTARTPMQHTTITEDDLPKTLIFDRTWTGKINFKSDKSDNIIISSIYTETPNQDQKIYHYKNKHRKSSHLLKNILQTEKKNIDLF